MNTQDTPRTNTRRSSEARLAFVQAEEIARGVSFLCSDKAGFVTGSTLSINGGQHMY